MPDEVASLRRALSIYRGLVEVSGLINSITEFDELLRAILAVARRVIAAEAASLFLSDENTGGLRLVLASYGDGEFVEPQIDVPKGRGIAGSVAESGESLLIPDAYADSRFYPEADKATGFKTRSILCTPLWRGDEVIGVLQLLNPRDKSAFDPEDLEGFVAYAELIATALEKVRTVERMRTQDRVERELAIAAEIQSDLLSRAIPESLSGFQFASHNQAASNVGGDFFHVFVRSPYEIYFAIGDVSGKGMPAAILMAQTLSAMQFVFRSTTSPSNALAQLNETLSDQVSRGMFVTSLVGRITPFAHRIEIASAGHCKPVIVRKDGTRSFLEIEGALPLGIKRKVAYRQGKLSMEPGDMIVLYTDGLSESRHGETQQSFEETMLDALQGQDFTHPQELIDTLIEAEKTHREPAALRDDLTILAGGFA